MKWEQIDRYLSTLASLLGVGRDELIFTRQATGAQPFEIVESSCEWGYLKPDGGYTAPLSIYKVSLKAKPRPLEVTSWCLTEMPGCCAFVVSTRAYVGNNFRNKGVNRLSNRFRQEIAKSEGYTGILCTDLVDNVGERKTLDSEGFQHVFEVVNRRTSNHISLSVKDLR